LKITNGLEKTPETFEDQAPQGFQSSSLLNHLEWPFEFLAYRGLRLEGTEALRTSSQSKATLRQKNQ
jgi:hypothetical protein